MLQQHRLCPDLLATLNLRPVLFPAMTYFWFKSEPFWDGSTREGNSGSCWVPARGVQVPARTLRLSGQGEDTRPTSLPPETPGSRGQHRRLDKLLRVRVKVVALVFLKLVKGFSAFSSLKKIKAERREISEPVQLWSMSAMVRFSEYGQEVTLVYTTLPPTQVPQTPGEGSVTGGSGPGSRGQPLNQQAGATHTTCRHAGT